MNPNHQQMRSVSPIHRFATRLVLLSLLFLTVAAVAGRIKHVIVLMEENRSFDHLFGYSNRTKRGLSGREVNPINDTNPTDGVIRVNDNATYINECDPNHSLDATSYKIFGEEAFKVGNLSVPLMNGFVQWERDEDGHKDGRKSHYCGVMQAFAPEKLPVINKLAEEFLLFDNFYASVPGPTWPNRMFSYSGTSGGLTATGPWYHLKTGHLFPQKTLFDQVAEQGGKWRLYYNDTPWEFYVQSIAHHPEHTRPVTEFFQDCRDGTLPHFSFINPRSGVNLTEGVGSNDQHPDHDVAVGEQFIKDIYEAVRASPQWNETLLILTYDEHGGFYDHVKPPMGIPPPGDGEASYPDKHFAFDRAGMRVPALLISPWVKRGAVVSDPPAAAKPKPNSIFELTSIIQSTRSLLEVLQGTKPLTQRDAWAADFSYLVNELDAPRTDCPEHLPAAPPPTEGGLMREAHSGINELQEHIMTVHAHLANEAAPHRAMMQHEVGPFVHRTRSTHVNNVAQWKASKNLTLPYVLRLVPVWYAYKPLAPSGKKVDIVSWSWSVNRQNATLRDPSPSMTISISLPDPSLSLDSAVVSSTSNNTEYCLDVGGAPSNGTRVAISRCFPSSDPARNRDIAQHVVLGNDATIRPFHDSSLCVETPLFRVMDPVLYLRPCDGSVHQHWAYHGPGVGESGDGALFHGDDEYAISILKRGTYIPNGGGGE